MTPDLQYLLAVADDEACAALMSRGTLTNTISLIADGRRRLTLPGGWANDADRAAILEGLRLMATAEAAVGLIWAAEAWAVLDSPDINLRASQSDRREEALIVLAMARIDGDIISAHRIRRIQRDLQGTITGLPEAAFPADGEMTFGGAIADILPTATPSPADRRAARAALERATKRTRRGKAAFD